MIDRTSQLNFILTFICLQAYDETQSMNYIVHTLIIIIIYFI